METHNRLGFTSLILMAILISCLQPVVAAVAQPAEIGKKTIDMILGATWTKKGICVQIGCCDGTLTSEIASVGQWVVQALDKDSARVDKARAALQSKGLYGQASVDVGGFDRLPYEDNLIDLVVVDDLPQALGQKLALTEVARILTPNGTAAFGGIGAGDRNALQFKLEALGLKPTTTPADTPGWVVVCKLRDPKMDEWPQWRHDSGAGNVSQDALFGYGQQFRWVAEPFNSNGPFLVGVYGLRAANNRIVYYQMDWDPNGKDVVYWLMCRNAYNGTLLWRRPLPTQQLFAPRARALRVCPDWDAQISAAGVTAAPLDYEICHDWLDYDKMPLVRGLAIWSDRLFLATGNEWVCLDVTTGQQIGTLKGYDVPKQELRNVLNEGELIVSDGVVMACEAPFSDIKAWDAQTLAPLWKHPGVKKTLRYDSQFSPAVVASDGRAFVMDDASTFVALDVKTGREAWRVKIDQLPKGVADRGEMLQYSFGKLIVAKRGGNLFEKNSGTDKTIVYALSGKDGKALWNFECPTLTSRSNGLPAILAYPDEFWVLCGESFDALDPVTGVSKRHFDNPLHGFRGCSPPVGTANYFIYGKDNIHQDRKTLIATRLIGIRTPCSYVESGEATPANGLGYYMPFECKCGVNYRGLMVVAPNAPALPQNLADSDRLVKGTAAVPSPVAATPDDWPTYRKDTQRSNTTTSAGPDAMTQAWRTKIGSGKISPPTIAGGRVYVADIEGFQVLSLEATTGNIAWRFTTASRVDVPPTIDKGMCFISDHAGWVYCLNAANGGLIWKYRVPPMEARMAFCGKLESPWPVIGGVLVYNNLALVTVGRCSTMDGGVLDCALDATTGKVVWLNLVGTPKKPNSALAGDILVADAKGVYFNGHGLDLKTGDLNPTITPDGVLRATRGVIHQFLWEIEPYVMRRSFITDGRVMKEKKTAVAAMGPNIAFTDKTSYFGDFDPTKTGVDFLIQADGEVSWSTKLSGQHSVAFILAGKNIFLATIPANRDPQQKPQLLKLSTQDGKILKTVPLDIPPAIDGMAAGGGKLYLTTQDGHVCCFK